ncbi:MAG TPA: hypothetical protein VKY31_15240 [Terriglobia bacterium]|jgi:hypothetical protein|nr:hypothetical protein [Terriglobia bacterium]
MIKRVFGFVVIGALFFVSVQFAAVYFYAWEFDDFVRDEVKFAPMREGEEKENLKSHFQDHLTQQAQFYGLTLNPQDISVDRHTDTDSGITNLNVEVNYTTPVDLYYFTYPIRRHITANTMY